MGPSRRRILALAGAAVFAPSAARWGWAQAYLSRPVRVIVPVAAGGANDTTARLFAQKLTEILGQQFYVENLAGAGGNLGIGNRRASGAGRLHVASRRWELRDQSKPLYQNSVRSRARLRGGELDVLVAPRARGAPFGPGE